MINVDDNNRSTAVKWSFLLGLIKNNERSIPVYMTKNSVTMHLSITNAEKLEENNGLVWNN